MSDTIQMLIFGFLLFLISVYITRWIFGIDKIIDELKKQTKLNKSQAINLKILRRMVNQLARMQGVTDEQINAIVEESDSEVKNDLR